SKRAGHRGNCADEQSECPEYRRGDGKPLVTLAADRPPPLLRTNGHRGDRSTGPSSHCVVDEQARARTAKCDGDLVHSGQSHPCERVVARVLEAPQSRTYPRPSRSSTTARARSTCHGCHRSGHPVATCRSSSWLGGA